MKVNKSQAILFIYEKLITIGCVSREEVILKLSISNLTFYRYIQEIRAYIFNFNKGYELLYS